MDDKTTSNQNNYPLVLKVQDLKKITGLGIQSCYQMCKSEGFPAFKPPGQAIFLIPRDAFFRWLENNALNSDNKMQ